MMSASGWPRGLGSGLPSPRPFTGHAGLDSNHGSTDDLGQVFHQSQVSQQSHVHRFRSPVLHRVSSLFSLAASSVTSDHGGQGEREDRRDGEEADDGASTRLPTPLEQIKFGDEMRKGPEDMQPVSLLQIVESLQSAMMTRRDHTTGVPREYNAHIMALMEGFGHVNRRLEKTASELADLKQLREKELDEFRGLSEEWTRQGNEYKAEIKRLELLLAKESKDGVASVVMARSNTLIDRSGTKSFQARLKRLSSSRDEEEDGDMGSVRQVPEKVHFQRANTKPKTIDNIPRIIDHLSDIRLSRVVRDQDSRVKPSHRTDKEGLSDQSAWSPSRPSQPSHPSHPFVKAQAQAQAQAPVHSEQHASRDAHTSLQVLDFPTPDAYQPSAEELRERAGRLVDSSSSSGSGRGTGLSPVRKGSQVPRALWEVSGGYDYVQELQSGGPTLSGQAPDDAAGQGASLDLSGWLMDQQDRSMAQHAIVGEAGERQQGNSEAKRAVLDGNGSSAGNSRLRAGPRRARGFSFKAGDDVLPTPPIASTENYELAADLEALTSQVGVSQFSRPKSRLSRAEASTSGSEHVSPAVKAPTQQYASTTSAAPAAAPAAAITAFSASTLMSAAKARQRQGATVRRISKSESTGSVVYLGRTKSTESSGSSQAATQAAFVNKISQRNSGSFGSRLITLRRESEHSQTSSPVPRSNSQVSSSSCGRAATRPSLSPSGSANASFAPAASNRSGSRRGSSWSSTGSSSPAQGRHSSSPSSRAFRQSTSTGAVEAARIAANVAVARRTKKDSVEK